MEIIFAVSVLLSLAGKMVWCKRIQLNWTRQSMSAFTEE